MKIFKPTLIVLLTFCLFVLCITPGPTFGIRYTVSSSLPYKIFISRPFVQAVKNQYVSIEHPQSGILLAKKIIGIAGDSITIHEDHFFINKQDYGAIQAISRSGSQLHPIIQQEIPEGYVFVFAPHKESFDSRYQEFGLVKKEQLKETLWPLF